MSKCVGECVDSSWTGGGRARILGAWDQGAATGAPVAATSAGRRGTMHAASTRRGVLLLILLLALAFVADAGTLMPDDAPGSRAVPLLTQPTGGPTAGTSTAIAQLRADLLARWRRVLTALLGDTPTPACLEPPARSPGLPTC